MPEKESDVLRPQLVRAERSLKRALDEVCHTEVTEANTGELIRLEEMLAIANEAAKEAVSVRRRLRQGAPAEPTGDQIPRHEESGLGAHREFDDQRGVRWIVFAVYPSSARVARSGLRAQYQEGWLAFDSGVETRRLAPIPTDWVHLKNAELEAACSRAELAPQRQPRSK
jgi:hypothetical protein